MISIQQQHKENLEIIAQVQLYLSILFVFFLNSTFDCEVLHGIMYFSTFYYIGCYILMKYIITPYYLLSPHKKPFVLIIANNRVYSVAHDKYEIKYINKKNVILVNDDVNKNIFSYNIYDSLTPLYTCIGLYCLVYIFSIIDMCGILFLFDMLNNTVPLSTIIAAMVTILALQIIPIAILHTNSIDAINKIVEHYVTEKKCILVDRTGAMRIYSDICFTTILINNKFNKKLDMDNLRRYQLYSKYSKFASLIIDSSCKINQIRPTVLTKFINGEVKITHVDNSYDLINIDNFMWWCLKETDYIINPFVVKLFDNDNSNDTYVYINIYDMRKDAAWYLNNDDYSMFHNAIISFVKMCESAVWQRERTNKNNIEENVLKLTEKGVDPTSPIIKIMREIKDDEDNILQIILLPRDNCL